MEQTRGRTMHGIHLRLGTAARAFTAARCQHLLPTPPVLLQAKWRQSMR
jgi:hypothetical protein